MTFPKTHSDGEILDAAWANDLEDRASSAIGAATDAVLTDANVDGPVGVDSTGATSGQVLGFSGSPVKLVPVEGGGSSNYQTVEVGGAAETQRAKLNLIEGSGVTISAVDNSGADSTDVTISASGGGGSLPTGTDGQGLTYNGSAYVGDDRPIDLWNTQTAPSSVTDWGTIVNSLAASGKRFYLGPHDFPFSTQMNLKDKICTTFEGAGGLRWNQGQSITRLIWTGASGSGTAIVGGGAEGLIFRDLAIVYDTTGYDGDLTTFAKGATGNQSAFCVMEKVFLGADDGIKATARSVLNLEGAVCFKFDRGRIGDAISGVRGHDTGTNYVSNDNSIRRAMFINCTLGGIVNPGLDLLVEDCDWEFTQSTAPDMMGITQDVTGVTDRFHLSDCRFWDFHSTSPTQMSINQPASTNWDWSGERCNFHGAGLQVDLQGTGAVELKGSNFDSGNTNSAVIDCGPVATAAKDHIIIEGCRWGLTGSSDPIANYNGHAQVRIKNNGFIGNSTIAPSSEQIAAHQFVNVGQGKPSIAAHTGVTLNANTGIYGTDSEGILILQNTGGSIAAGTVADVTFARPMTSCARSQTYSSFLKVELTPIGITGVVTGSNSVAAGGYSVTPNAAVSTQTFTGFSVAVQNAIASSVAVAFAYRVVVL